MATDTLEEFGKDELAVSIARAVAIANEAASSQGARIAEMLITISEESSDAGRSWRIHYGPRDFVSRRGGDLTVWVDERGGPARIMQGQ